MDLTNSLTQGDGSERYLKEATLEEFETVETIGQVLIYDFSVPEYN